MTHGPIDGVLVGKHPLVSRLLKGIFNQRPPQPRYSSTWDVGVVLDHIKSWGQTVGLPRKDLTLKLAMLLALANASRSSELHALDIRQVSWNPDGAAFTLSALTKTSKPGKKKSLFYPRLEVDSEVCPVICLRQYLKVTEDTRKDHNLFLSYRKPYRAVKSCSIARWLKSILSMAGFSEFKAHSTRGAAVSAASNNGMSVSDILAVADWSSASTFKRFYYRQGVKPKALACSLVQRSN